MSLALRTDVRRWAEAFLRLARDEVAKQARQLEPAERTTFLENVATNAAIVEHAARLGNPEV